MLIKTLLTFIWISRTNNFFRSSLLKLREGQNQKCIFIRKFCTVLDHWLLCGWLEIMG